MIEKEKLNLVLKYKKTVQEIKEIVLSCSYEELDFRAQADHWTIREHTAHILDCEIFGFTRFRKAIAQPDSKVEAFDQDPWQLNLDYSIMDIHKSIQIIELLNDISTSLFLNMLDKDWKTYFVNHPEQGEIDIEKQIDRRESHIKIHIDYINRNKLLFKKNFSK